MLLSLEEETECGFRRHLLAVGGWGVWFISCVRAGWTTVPRFVGQNILDVSMRVPR